MEYDPKDQAIIELLTKMKNAGGGYPHKLLAARRSQYLRHAASLGLGVGIGTKLANLIKGESGKTALQSQVTSKILETALAVAIIAEAGTLAYFYRDKITELIQPSPTSVPVEVVASAAVNPSPLLQNTVAVLETPTPVKTPTITPTNTLLLEATVDTIDGAVDGAVDGANVENNARLTSTPNPNDDNGNHFGQTPKPERTRRPNREGRPTKERH